jgi:hypothetical protein
VIRAVSELRSVSQVWTTGYGRLLIVKTALLGMLVGIGWLNRYRLIPRGNLGGLRRSAVGELVLLAGLVVAVAILTDVRPGRNVASAAAAAPTRPPPLPPRDAVVLALEDRDDGVTLAVERRRIRIAVFDGQGLGVNGLDVTVAGAPTSACGPGCYEAQTSARGAVAVSVAGRRLVFHVPRAAPDASGLVARISRTFRSLRSVTYVERLASSVRNHIVSTFTLEAPDRLEYQIQGGSRGIVIGTKRWDDCVPSSSSILPQPATIWGTPITNAHLLARTRTEDIVSFLNPGVPAWFVLHVDRRTLRPRNLDMVATAHFMHHTYRGFNAPRRVFPPKC